MKLFAASKYALIFSIALLAVPLVACHENYCACVPVIPKIVFQFEEAIQNNDIGKVRKLIKEHLKDHDNINDVLDPSKRTPLHLAAELGRVEIAQLLIDEGKADINRQEIGGDTPMHIAVRYADVHFESDRMGVFVALLQAGASLDPQNRQGQTAFDVLGAYIEWLEWRCGRYCDECRVSYCMREMIKIEQKRRQEKKQRTKLDIAPLDAQNIITRARQFADRRLEDQLLTPRPQRHNPEMLSLLYGAASGL